MHKPYWKKELSTHRSERSILVGIFGVGARESEAERAANQKEARGFLKVKQETMRKMYFSD